MQYFPLIFIAIKALFINFENRVVQQAHELCIKRGEVLY